MREERQIAIPPKLITTYEKKSFVKCSFCGTEAAGVQGSTEIYWPTKNKSIHEIAETAIYWKDGHSYPESSSDGHSYPESGSGVYHEIHACPDCFKNKVIPVLETFALPAGTKFQETEWDW
jgi:hypothetical protein